MDDVNINKICLGIEEIELDGDEEEWIKLSWISDQSDNDGHFQSPEIQRDSDNEVAETKYYDDKISCTNAEAEDISDGISVITESDTDAINTNSFQVCQFNHMPYRPLQTLEAQRDTRNILIACVLGVIIGLCLSHLFTVPEICPISSGIDIESLKTASRNIVNTCKGLTEVKTMLNEIKAHIPADKKITKQLLAEFFENTGSSNKTNDKPIMVTKESFNSTSYPLDQLQVSLRVLSSLAFIYDDNNSSLKNEINKTLDIVNNIKAFYDTLVLFNNNTQDMFNPIVVNFLQHDTDKMHVTSKNLLSDLVEKMRKVTSKVYNKYTKERHRLNKKLCQLKSILPNDKFLLQLTKNNQLFKDYDKSCFSNHIPKNLDGETSTEGNAKTSNIKKQIKRTDDAVLHTKYNKKNIHKTDDNKESSSKNKRNERQNADKSTTMKFLQNARQKIHNTSRLLLSKIVEKVSKLRHQLSKKLHHLESILPNSSEFLKQLIEDEKENYKKLFKSCEGKNDYLQSTVPKDGILKNRFDNILMQLKDTCPLSTNYCPKFNVNMTTFDIVPNHKTKNHKRKKYDTNNKKTILDHGNSAKILPAEGKSRPKKKKDCSKSNGKNISSQNIIKNHISEHTDKYKKSKRSSFDNRTIKPDNQHYTDTDRKSDIKRSHEYKKQRQLDASDWYFQRAHSRRNARRRAEDIYQQDTKWFRIDPR